MLVSNPLVSIHGLSSSDVTSKPELTPLKDWKDGIVKDNGTNLNPNGVYDQNTDLGKFLSDQKSTFDKKWDPWLTQGAVHAVASTADGDMMAIATGYLYDNQIHVYRYNHKTLQYDHVWEVGGGVFQSDVFTLDFADTDYNNLTEIIAGGNDGRIYVFEQRHLYDPVTNMENMFDLVWTSPRLGRIFSVTVDDTDMDFRKDIVIGTGDTVRWYEYDNHSNYPFTKDHWMTFREVSTFKANSQITALGVSDVNSNGLKEVAVGQKSGEIQLLENAGVVIPINGKKFPYYQDNTYRQIWSSNNTLRRGISSMSGGDLDNDGYRELLIAVQGQGAYVLDQLDGQLGTYRIERPFAPWESNMTAFYSLDYYIDSMVNSSSMFNGTWLPLASANVYYKNITNSYQEPFNISKYVYDNYPYNSETVRVPDNKYTTLDGTKVPGKAAWAVYDFGHDEEAAGNGVPTQYDLSILLHSTSTAVNPTDIEISISADNVNFHKIDSKYIKFNSSVPLNTYYRAFNVEVDPTLINASLDYYRYINITVFSKKLVIDSMKTLSINNPIYDAQSTEVGPLLFKGETVAEKAGFIGTIDGTILAVTWNPTMKRYTISWDSWVNERFKLKKNIFDMELVHKSGRFPSIIGNKFLASIADFTSGLINPFNGFTEKVVSYSAENFYNYQQEPRAEFVISTDSGRLLIYRQQADNSPLVLDKALSKQMFDTPMVYSSKLANNLTTVMQYINQRKALANGPKYFTVSFVPLENGIMDGFLGTQLNIINTPFLMLLGEWTGSLGDLQAQLTGVPDSPVQNNDLTMWYVYNFPLGNAACDPALEQCTTVVPYMNDRTNAPYSLKDLDLTGQMLGYFRQSSWMPKIAGGDFIGSSSKDLVLTNGKLMLLEVSYSADPNYIPTKPKNQFVAGPSVWGSFSPTSQIIYTANPSYFSQINEMSNGRQWTNPYPVDFDNDGDLDLILSFARYDTTTFTVDLKKYGMTYFENAGTRNNPIWIERKKAVTNNDPDSNLRVNLYTDPVFINDNYDLKFGYYPTVGYHPYFKTGLPSRLVMFNLPSISAGVFDGKLNSFKLNYEPGTSLMVATYPETKRLDINLMDYNMGLLGQTNFGYHIFESWNNGRELNNWTLSLSTADMDQDGKNEVIVGDFNNNAYVFEHLTNNTYKRAYKTPDINRTVVTDQSPYASNLFTGISGNFNRTIFNHATFTMAGVDLNNNTLQEFIIATDSVLYVFESYLTRAGRIRDDSYRLIAQIDLYSLPALSRMDRSLIKVSSLTWANDITNDGNRELVVAVGPALLIFDIQSLNHDTSLAFVKQVFMNRLDSNLFNWNEIFFKDTYNATGKYNMPGNYLISLNQVISSVLVEDINKNGKMNIVIAGKDLDTAKPIRDGFIRIYEWTGVNFDQIIAPEVFKKTTQFNMITDLETDDADHDGLTELIIGHQNGIDIYEVTGSNTVEYRETITSNPHYQVPKHNYLGLGRTPTTFTNAKDVVLLSNGTLLMAYVVQVTKGNFEIRVAGSNDDGATWIQYGAITYSGTASASYPGALVAIESIDLLIKGGLLWLSFAERRSDTPTTDVAVFYVIRNLQFKTSNTAYFVSATSVTRNSEQSASPQMFNFPNASTTEVGFVYFNFQNSSLWFLRADTAYAGIFGTYFSASTRVLWANGSVLGEKFLVHSLSVYDQPRGNSLDFAFAGYPRNESLSLAVNLYYVSVDIFRASSWMFNFTKQPTKVLQGNLPIKFPSIIRMQDTGALLISFEQLSLKPFGGLYAAWSNDLGTSWNGPYSMTHPYGLDLPLLTALPTPSKESYRVGTYDGRIMLDFFDVRRPVLVPTKGSGFTQVYNVYFTTNLRREGSIGYCASYTFNFGDIAQTISGTCDPYSGTSRVLASFHNPWSNFTTYSLRGVTDLTVGDTDNDGRHEILALSGNQAYLYEFAHNSKTFIRHVETWISDPYDQQLRKGAISDANGNGIPEIILETARGVVNSFELVKANKEAPNLKYPILDATISTTAGMNNLVREIIPVDVNADGVDDILYNTQNGELVAINGKDNTLIYNVLSPSLPLRSTSHAIFNDVNLVLISHKATGKAEFVVMPYNNLLYIYKLDGTYVGSKILGINGTDFISGIQAINLDNSGFDELVVSVSNGTIVAYDMSNLVVRFSVPSSKSFITNEYIETFRVAHYLSNSSFSLVTVTNNGFFEMFDLTTLTSVWTKQTAVSFGRMDVSTSTDWNVLNVGDFNGDGLDDLAGGLNTTIVLKGSNGDQLWNQTNSNQVIQSEAIVEDINGDGIVDFIITYYSSLTPNALIMKAVSGLTGTVLWSYQLKDQAGLVIPESFVSSLLAPGKRLITAGLYAFDSYGLVSSAETGQVMLGVKNPISLLSSALLEKGQAEPKFVTGDLNGTVRIYSIYDGTPPVNRVKTPQLQKTPFIRVGSDFTERTKFFVQDVFGGDGIDDIFVVDDNYIGGADTNRLLNDPSYNTVEWSKDLKFSGKLLTAIHGDFNKDGKAEIVVAFENYWMSVDMRTGSVLWNKTLPISSGNIALSMSLQNASLNKNLPGTQIAFSLVEKNPTSGDNITSFGYINPATGDLLDLYFFTDFKNPSFTLVDIDKDGYAEFVGAINHQTNPLVNRYVIYQIDQVTGKFIIIKDAYVTGYPPISQVIGGEFDLSNTKREFTFVFDYSRIKIPFPMYDFSRVPSIMFTLTADLTTKVLQATNNTIGVAPFGGEARRYMLTDYNKDGLNEVIIQTGFGDLYQIQYGNSGIYIKTGGKIASVAVPYAETPFLVGNFFAGVSNAMAVVISSDAMSLYDNAKLDPTATPKGSVVLAIDTIQDIIPGHYDKDTITDIMVISKAGYVWVVNSVNLSPLQLNEKGIVKPEQQSTVTDRVEVIPGLMLTIFVMIIILRRKKKN